MGGVQGKERKCAAQRYMKPKPPMGRSHRLRKSWEWEMLAGGISPIRLKINRDV